MCLGASHIRDTFFWGGGPHNKDHSTGFKGWVKGSGGPQRASYMIKGAKLDSGGSRYHVFGYCAMVGNRGSEAPFAIRLMPSCTPLDPRITLKSWATSWRQAPQDKESRRLPRLLERQWYCEL